ncbi:unnamed protein product [Soboliphyme baturini]|uniref:Replication termination factor 2 n=1 Tax=Soboliphyme baturini TaxID=241478 RepID=A0A183IXD7_9BILA|nr:unnamed protein product [Soboliphyme baturini]
MGCDGGTIPRRDELVRTKKKPEQVERDVAIAAKWEYCTLSQQKLREPIVACRLGRLYNKEAVLEALLKKGSGVIEGAEHIQHLKDVKELKLTRNPAYDANRIDKGGEYSDNNIAPYICPIVGIEMNGKYRFCVIWSCGCVLSEKALKEVKSDGCNKCGKSYTPDSVVVIYGTDEEVNCYKDRLCAAQSAGPSVKRKVREEAFDSGLPSTSKQNDVKKFKSIQENGKVSEVYKSLFTTSEAAKNHPTAHWITYNPLYY